MISHERGDNSWLRSFVLNFLAANGAHITHMLRDIAEDISEGYVNESKEYLEKHNIE